ncbi:MAG: hypothetical protein PHS14_10385 [Elusimicrobia bacterium]|nr:hypothetical protein [Elusimicrobiota bacterium]
MIKSKTDNWPVLAAALFCFAACGKKDDGAPTPVLSAPGAIEKVSAQAEVKASSGPVELSLLLHKTEIKAGDYLWQQIRLRNSGDTPMIVADQVFHDPWELRKHSGSGYGIYVEALGPDGKPLKVEYSREKAAPPKDEEVSGLLEVEGPQEQAMLDDWKKKGLSPEEINQKLLDFNMKKRLTTGTKRRSPVIKLLPGQSAETKSSFFYSLTDEINEKPVPKPIGDFGQINFFHFNKPGQYKIRAVYDYRPGEFARENKLPTSPDDLLVRTPWISVTVLP